MAETPLKVLEKATFAVITRLRKDKHNFNNKGGKLTSNVDPRVCVVVPKGAYRFSTEMTLKVYIHVSLENINFHHHLEKQ